ncbi:hypothetical protein BDFB_010570 [Asbolus verrucosus]|uniref:Uncharacterized protein n=1 Tax=Asbolus verrucosus TaxID=1661398 RepID=A0A482V938_ASBVE|nr:hypothetical protein BDFB_010570 [Asbolus verrucosus]
MNGLVRQHGNTYKKNDFSFYQIVAVFAILAVASAAPSGHIGGAVVAGPAGVVTSHGAVGAVGHGLGLGLGLAHGGASAVVAGPTASAVVSGPVAGLGLGLGLGHVGALGGGVITNGGGAIGVSAHGAAVRGPGTAPVVVAGPSGKIAAAGLWGPTANIGLGHHGHGW